MIEYIRGELTELTPALAVLEAAGVGYGLNISLNTYSAIQGKKEVKLYVHESLVTGGRDDNFDVLRLLLEAGTRLVSPAYHRVWGGRQHGPNDFVHALAGRIV